MAWPTGKSAHQASHGTRKYVPTGDQQVEQRCGEQAEQPWHGGMYAFPHAFEKYQEDCREGHVEAIAAKVAEQRPGLRPGW
jgi:hypothetical protein